MQQNSSSSAQHTETSAVSFSSELELRAAVKEESNAVSKASGVHVVKRRERLDRLKNCLFSKSCAVYTLIIAFVWVLHFIPILVFIASSSTVSLFQTFKLHILNFPIFQYIADDVVLVNNTDRNGINCIIVTHVYCTHYIQ